MLPLLSLAVVATSSRCRFAPSYQTQDIFANASVRQSFFLEHARGEAVFMKTIGLDKSTGLTYDGQRLDYTTGLPRGEPHTFSAPSKESLHLAVLARVLKGDSAIADVTYTKQEALQILEQKVTSLETFNKNFPGFGGFIPWVVMDGKGGVKPTWDWQNRVPSLDNGEIFWAAFAVAEVLSSDAYAEHKALQQRWEAVWQRMIDNVVKIFYYGNGLVCDVVSLTNQSRPVSENNYTCVSNGYLDDPYEGELVTLMIYLFSKDASAADKDKLWVQKRKKLQPATLTVDSTTKITTQRGWWFSAHESWKYLMLPYQLSTTNYRTFLNGERARTHYAAKVAPSPGLWASVNGPVANNDEDFPYFSDCGVQELAFQRVGHNDVVTPYGAFSLMIASQPHGAAWLHHMLLQGRAQNCYGTTEGWNISGAQIAPLTTWDSKITTLVSILGGVVDINQAALQKRNLLNSFVSIVEKEWSAVFTLPLAGENLPFLLPTVRSPTSLSDFTTCSATSPDCF